MSMIQENDNKDFILVESSDMEVSVVRSESDKSSTEKETIDRHGKRWRLVALVVGIIAVCLLLVIGWIGYRRYDNIGIPISRQPDENIAILERTMNSQSDAKPGVTMTSDSIFGVAMDMYKLEGLRGTLQMTEPDITDTSVYMYVRSADYHADGTYIGAIVVDGEELKNTNHGRNGYVAMLGNGMVIGISRSNAVKDFVQEKGGSFFRQFILVSNGIIPIRFYLHGKVERRALGRIGDTLYVICTRHKETMWDFADALREYGFVDAIYITGGDDYTFYRTADGTAHAFGTDETHAANIPWLVFRK